MKKVEVEIREIAESELNNMIYEYSRQHDLSPEDAEEQFMKVYDFITDFGYKVV